MSTILKIETWEIKTSWDTQNKIQALLGCSEYNIDHFRYAWIFYFYAQIKIRVRLNGVMFVGEQTIEND